MAKMKKEGNAHTAIHTESLDGLPHRTADAGVWAA